MEPGISPPFNFNHRWYWCKGRISSIKSRFMAKRNGMAVVSVSIMTNAKPDRNLKLPIILSALAGSIPSVRTISGTVADSMNLIAGKAHLVSFQETDEQEFVNRAGELVKGAQFEWANAGVCTPMEVAALLAQLGIGKTFEVEAPVIVITDPKVNGAGNENLNTDVNGVKDEKKDKVGAK